MKNSKNTLSAKKRGNVFSISTESIFAVVITAIGLGILATAITSTFTSKSIIDLQGTNSQSEIEQMELGGNSIVETIYLDKDVIDSTFSSVNSGSGVRITGTNIQDFTGGKEIGVAIVASKADNLVDTASTPNAVEGIGGDNYDETSATFDDLDYVRNTKYILSASDLSSVKGITKVSGTLTDGKVPFLIDATDTDSATEIGLFVYKTK